MLVGVVVALPAIRLSNVGVAMMTIGLAVAISPVVQLFSGLTNGPNGMGVEAVGSPFGSHLDPQVYLYYVCLAVFVIVVCVVRGLTRGRLGRAWDALRENEIAALAMGINVSYYKSVALSLSALCGGLGGGLYVLLFSFVDPDTFTLFFSFILIVALVIGGPRSVYGAILGGAFIVYAPQAVGDITQSINADVIYGVLLVLLMWIAPDGILPTLGKVVSGAGGRAFPAGLRRGTLDEGSPGRDRVD